jgi:hypothetical protein
MRIVPACLAAIGLLAACSTAPAAQSNAAPLAATAPVAASSTGTAAAAPSAAAPVSGVYTAAGKPAVLTDVSIHPDDPFDGKPVFAIVFTVAPQGGDADAANDAHQGKFGDAIVIRVDEDGTIIGADMMHRGLDKTGGYISTVGVLSIDHYLASGGEISGHVTSGGPNDAGAGQQVNVDLTFHAKAPQDAKAP